MELPQPTHKNYTTLISNIENGEIKIPQFQRDFVWTLQRSAELLDSVVKGYPIGTFIFWLARQARACVYGHSGERTVNDWGVDLSPSWPETDVGLGWGEHVGSVFHRDLEPELRRRRVG